MKNYILLLFIVLATSQASFSKRVDKDALIDSLKKANAALTLQMDSVSKDLTIYKDFYNVIKERIVKHDFDPGNISHMIDSAYALDNASTASFAIIKDSLAYYKNENASLKSSVNGITQPESVNTRLVYELKQIKDLLDSHILTPAEFDIKKEAILRRWQ